MGSRRSTDEDETEVESGRDEPVRLGSQTLFRGLDVLDVVADGPISLSELAERLELTDRKSVV